MHTSVSIPTKQQELFTSTPSEQHIDSSVSSINILHNKSNFSSKVSKNYLYNLQPKYSSHPFINVSHPANGFYKMINSSATSNQYHLSVQSLSTNSPNVPSDSSTRPFNHTSANQLSNQQSNQPNRDTKNGTKNRNLKVYENGRTNKDYRILSQNRTKTNLQSHLLRPNKHMSSYQKESTTPNQSSSILVAKPVLLTKATNERGTRK